MSGASIIISRWRRWNPEQERGRRRKSERNENPINQLCLKSQVNLTDASRYESSSQCCFYSFCTFPLSRFTDNVLPPRKKSNTQCWIEWPNDVTVDHLILMWRQWIKIKMLQFLIIWNIFHEKIPHRINWSSDEWSTYRCFNVNNF